MLKNYFSRQLPLEFKQSQNQSQSKKHEVEIWQRRFWEHTISSEQDYINHLNYIHFNPVKHGWVHQVKDWDFPVFIERLS